MTYDRQIAKVDKAGLGDSRAGLLAGAAGRVLEIGGGTGNNLRFYGPAVESLTITEPEIPMLRRLERKVREQAPAATVLRAPATLMGVATIAHWDKFLHTHVAFWLWAGLYFTTPFLVFWVFLANRKHDAPATGADLLLSVGVSRIIAVVGGLSLLTGVFLFLLPNRAVTIWPWALTPLTSRVVGAIFCLGIAGLGALFDRRWSSARVLLQVAALMLALIVAAGARATGELDSANVMTWLISGGFVAVLAAIVVLYLRMEARLAEPAVGAS